MLEDELKLEQAAHDKAMTIFEPFNEKWKCRRCGSTIVNRNLHLHAHAVRDRVIQNEAS